MTLDQVSTGLQRIVPEVLSEEVAVEITRGFYDAKALEVIALQAKMRQG